MISLPQSRRVLFNLHRLQKCAAINGSLRPAALPGPAPASGVDDQRFGESFEVLPHIKKLPFKSGERDDADPGSAADVILHLHDGVAVQRPVLHHQKHGLVRPGKLGWLWDRRSSGP